MKKKRNKVYLVLEELNFIWSMKETREFRKMWREGYSVHYMAEYFEREDPDEVVLLAMCQIKRGKIEQRRGGFLGWRS